MILGTVKGLAPLTITTSASETPAPAINVSGAVNSAGDRVLADFVSGKLYIIRNLTKQVS